MTSHPDVTGRGCGICGKLLLTFQQIPQPRRRLDEIKKSVLQTSGARGTRSGKLYLLDTGLLMGGTHAAPMWEAHVAEPYVGSIRPVRGVLTVAGVGSGSGVRGCCAGTISPGHRSLPIREAAPPTGTRPGAPERA